MLSDATFNAIYNLVSEMFEAPERQLVFWIEQNTKYFLEFDKFYRDCDPAKMIYLDTEDREHVMDVIATYFLKTSWPRFREGDEHYKKFINDLKLAISRYQWKIKGEENAASS